MLKLTEANHTMHRLDKVRTQMATVEDPARFLEGAFAFSPLGILVVNDQGHIVLANPAYRDIFGESHPNYSIFEDDMFKGPGLQSEIKKVFDGALIDVPVVWQAINGAKVGIKVQGYPVFGKDHKLACAVFMFKDVTDELEIKRRLTEVESRYRSLYESSILAIFSCDVATGQIKSANPGFFELSGYTRDDIAKRTVSWPAMTPREYAELDQRGIDAIKATGVCLPFEKEYIKKDGTRVPILIGAALVEGSESEVIAYALDLSEVKALEQQCRHTQKMETLGLFAGAISHDFNNMLSLILLHSEQALEQSMPEQASIEVKAIRKTAERAARLTRKILAFSRKQPFAKHDVNVNAIVWEMKDMLSRLIGEDISIELDRTPAACYVNGDQGQIEQLIMNLVTNARDAIAGAGSITIGTSIRTLTERDVRSLRLRLQPGGYVELSVKDTGCGMDASLVKKIFEPFFTTKKDNRGTGLGLPTVMAIAQQSNGDILVESALGEGSLFKVYFPVCEEPKTQASPTSETTPSEGDLETILLIEDEEDLRNVTTTILRKSRYNVISASNGMEALELYKLHKNEISLIVTDVMLPQMIGPEFIQSISAANEKGQPKVLYVSGYSTADLQQHGVSDDDVHFLEKPFTSTKLLSKIRDVLAAKR